MWLKLNLDGIILSLQIRNYIKVSDDDWGSTWCKTDFSFCSEPWLNYHKTNDEVFLASEIDDLAHMLKDLLDGSLTESIEFNCIEPDFNFFFHPKYDVRNDPKVVYVKPGHEIADIDMEWRVSFWNGGGLTANYLSVTLNRDDIENLFLYLQLVMSKVSENDPAVVQRIKDNIIYANQG